MNRIRELRIAAGKSQAELADIIGINKQAISQYERGVRYPRPEIMEALTDYFNVSTEYLMGKVEVSPLLITPDERRFLDASRCRKRKTPHKCYIFRAAWQNSWHKKRPPPQMR